MGSVKDGGTIVLIAGAVLDILAAGDDHKHYRGVAYMKMRRIILVAAMLLLLSAQAASAYQAALKAGVSKAEVGKGETFTYTLSITEEGEADRRVQLRPPDFESFNVGGSFSSTNVRVIQGKARRVTEQTYRLSTDKPGSYVIPPAALVLTDPATGEEQEVASEAVRVVVSEKPRGAIQGIEEDIRGLKEPKTFLDRVKLYFYGMLALVVLAVLILVGFALYVLTKKTKKTVAAVAGDMPGLSPKERALRDIAAAELRRSEPVVFYTQVTDAVRRYISETRGIQAMEATTAELMARVKGLSLPQGMSDTIGRLFMEADMVKFAKYVPDEAEIGRFLESARSVVNGI